MSAKTGYWIINAYGVKCSECLIVHRTGSLFCPSCGAKMIKDAPKIPISVLQEIRKEIDEQTGIHSDGELYIKNYDVKCIIDKHIKEYTE